MSTFIGQLVGFGVIVFVFVKYLLPLIRRMMQSQQETIRRQLEESAEAAEKVARADAEHAKAVQEAKDEASRVVEEARVDAQNIAEQLRVQADTEVERIKVQGGQQIELLRQQLIRELRQNLGTESILHAEKLVRDYVSDAAARSTTVDRFLDDLDAMAPSDGVISDPVAAKLRSASREALAATVDRLDAVAAGLDGAGLSKLAEDLSSVAALLSRESMLTKCLAEPADASTAKGRLVDQLLSGKVGSQALDVVKSAVSQRWSAEPDLVIGVQHAARLALLLCADRSNVVDEVEEQLFRFSRVLDSQPRLSALLGDIEAPAQGRVGLLENVLEERVHPITLALLEQTIGQLDAEHADAAVRELAELAVARRGEVVAQVTAAAELSEGQRARLAALLSRIYNHPVSVRLHLNPELLGGLTITVGDEVIDGSLSSRLAAAKTQLPD